MGRLLLPLVWLGQLGLELDLELDDLPELHGNGPNVVKLLRLLREPNATSRKN
jgi:hypothetical protein